MNTRKLTNILLLLILAAMMLAATRPYVPRNDDIWARIAQLEETVAIHEERILELENLVGTVSR